MSKDKTFTDTIVACLISNAPEDLESRQAELTALVARILDEVPEQQPDRLNLRPSRAQIDEYLADIRAILPKAHDRIALVAGGATKIKGYVFEAPKLPEIRGASALLDWVNEVELPRLWGVQPQGSLTDEEQSKLLAQHGIIYASGSGFLAFASASRGAELAAAVERCYTEHTLTANSVAVSQTFSLLELRYGRLNIKEDKLPYWIDEFLKDWEKPELHFQLAQYYYGDKAEESVDRFYRRKTFGELVTLLATMTNRRRDERARHGEVRNVPFYQLSPWDAVCDSSGVRPAVWSGTVVDEERQLSEASARKRYVGQIVKNDNEEATKWYRNAFPHWIAPATLHDRSWEHEWEDYISAKEQRSTPYAGFMYDPENEISPKSIEPPKDVGQISQASSPQCYIGVIYADGNNVGRLVATLQTPRLYHAVSKVLSDVATEAVFQALTKHLHPIEITLTAKEKQSRRTSNDTIWVHPFEILAIGGDDLFILVPGHTALDVATSISMYFEAMITEKLRELNELKLPLNARSTASHKQRFAAETTLSNHDYVPTIGLSAGVIIAQENAPIFFLRDLVEELLKSAKGLAKENAKRGFYGGAVDFMVMKSITMVTDKIKSFRRQALGDDGKDSNRRLTARPYTWHEFAGLLHTVRELKKAHMPRSQLYRLRRALDADAGSGITSSVMEYLYTRVRLQSVYGEALRKQIEEPWCWETPVANRATKLPPWMPLDKQGWETIWADMLESYEMVPEEVQP